MKSVILFLALLAVGSDAAFKPGLKVRFDIGLNVGKDFFINMPRTISEARNSKWTKMERPLNSHLRSLDMWCMIPTPYGCCLFDSETETLAGYQVGVPLNEFTGAYFDWNIQGFLPWEVATANGTVTFMTKQVYFISEATLGKSKTKRLEIAAKGEIMLEDAVWLVGYNQQLMKVPASVSGIEATGWVKQSCIPLMGQHYFHNMTRDTKCSSNTILNYFLLVDGGRLIGVGFFVIGYLPNKPGETFYFERPSRGQTKTIIKYSPDCLLDLAEKPSATTMHIYLIDNPWNVGCLPF